MRTGAPRYPPHECKYQRNVAFGCNPDKVNDDEIWLALKSSKLANYVSKLPYGMYTIVGEDGVIFLSAEATISIS